MNKRIKELWDKAAQAAAAYPSGQNNSWETQVNFMDNFAESIVRECISIADKESERYSNLDQEYCSMAMDNYMELVRRHFGVTE